MEMYLVADGAVTAAALRQIPHCDVRPILFFVPGKTVCGYYVTCSRERFDAVKLAVSKLCSVILYSYSTEGPVHRIDFRAGRITSTGGAFVATDENPERGIKFSDSGVCLAFVKD